MFTVKKLNSKIARRIECASFGKFVKVCDTKSDDFCILTDTITETLEKIKKMKVYDDDVWIVS